MGKMLTVRGVCVIVCSVLIFGLVAACSSYTKPTEDFLNASIQFPDSALTKRNISVAAFVQSVQNLRGGDKDTRIRGWTKGDRTWTLVSESAGEKYEYRFTDVLTDRSGKATVVFQGVTRNGAHQDATTLLNLVLR